MFLYLGIQMTEVKVSILKRERKCTPLPDETMEELVLREKQK